MSKESIADELRKASKRICDLRGELLFGTEDPDGDMGIAESMEYSSPEAEQFFLLALGDLDSAIRHLRLAEYRMMKGE